eukprot:g70288.t1
MAASGNCRDQLTSLHAFANLNLQVSVMWSVESKWNHLRGRTGSRNARWSGLKKTKSQDVDTTFAEAGWLAWFLSNELMLWAGQAIPIFRPSQLPNPHLYVTNTSGSISEGRKAYASLMEVKEATVCGSSVFTTPKKWSIKVINESWQTAIDIIDVRHRSKSANALGQVLAIIGAKRRRSVCRLTKHARLHNKSVRAEAKARATIGAKQHRSVCHLMKHARTLRSLVECCIRQPRATNSLTASGTTEQTGVRRIRQHRVECFIRQAPAINSRLARGAPQRFDAAFWQAISITPNSSASVLGATTIVTRRRSVCRLTKHARQRSKCARAEEQARATTGVNRRRSVCRLTKHARQRSKCARAEEQARATTGAKQRRSVCHPTKHAQTLRSLVECSIHEMLATNSLTASGTAEQADVKSISHHRVGCFIREAPAINSLLARGTPQRFNVNLVGAAFWQKFKCHEQAVTVHRKVWDSEAPGSLECVIHGPQTDPPGAAAARSLSLTESDSLPIGWSDRPQPSHHLHHMTPTMTQLLLINCFRITVTVIYCLGKMTLEVRLPHRAGLSAAARQGSRGSSCEALSSSGGNSAPGLSPSRPASKFEVLGSVLSASTAGEHNKGSNSG